MNLDSIRGLSAITLECIKAAGPAGVTTAQMMQQLGIDRRTVRSRVCLLREYGIDVKSQVAEGGMRYGWPTLDDDGYRGAEGRLWQWLEQSPGGVLSKDAGDIGVPLQSARNAFSKWHREGRVVAHLEPDGYAHRQYRYWHPQHAPASYTPPPLPPKAGRQPRERAAKVVAPVAKRNDTPLPKFREHGLTIKPRALVDLGARAPEGEVVIPPHVKVQVLPSSPTYGRHALPPGTRVAGGFASMGIGRYLDEART